jgi:hypothetical protein
VAEEETRDRVAQAALAVEKQNRLRLFHRPARAGAVSAAGAGQPVSSHIVTPPGARPSSH